uniref:Bm6143 n=1 Tax=Brugia malayi TaxID=6279 RepID=A0A0J9XY95_BRUMA|nr:Bm6143 [Brugia malayi]
MFIYRPARRQLFIHTSDDHPLNFIRATKWSPAKKKRILPNLFNGDYDAHYARDDCEALLKICIAYGEEFVEYVDTHAVKFPF